jgi:hypothetical protein
LKVVNFDLGVHPSIPPFAGDKEVRPWPGCEQSYSQGGLSLDNVIEGAGHYDRKIDRLLEPAWKSAESMVVYTSWCFVPIVNTYGLSNRKEITRPSLITSEYLDRRDSKMSQAERNNR